MVLKRASSVFCSAILISVGMVAVSAAEPIYRVEVISPAAGQTAEGILEVRVRISPIGDKPAPEVVLAGLGGPPWHELTYATQAKEWVGLMDSSLVPNGGQVLRIVTPDKRSKAATELNVKNPLRCYFAGLHGHTGYSDGTLTPATAHEYARNTANLDVFILTDHLEQVDSLEWADMREQAWKANEDGQFVSFPGLEWTKKQGHTIIYDPQSRRWPVETESFYKAVADAGVVVKFNHPGNGTNVFDGLAFSEIGDQAVQLMEVRREQEQQAFIRALDQGWHIAPDGADDTHSPNWGNVRSWTGIIAPGLSRRTIWDALQNRHCYSTLDRNCRLFFEVNGAVMGDILPDAVTKVRFSVKVEDPDAGDAIAKVELYEDGVVIQSNEPNNSSVEWRPAYSPEVGSHYYFVKATQADGQALWSAPIWLTVARQ